jgi:hypothetical protein
MTFLAAQVTACSGGIPAAGNSGAAFAGNAMVGMTQAHGLHMGYFTLALGACYAMFLPVHPVFYRGGRLSFSNGGDSQKCDQQPSDYLYFHVFLCFVICSNRAIWRG